MNRFGLLSRNFCLLPCVMILVALCGSEVPPYIGSEPNGKKKTEVDISAANEEFYDSGTAFLSFCSTANRLERKAQNSESVHDARACQSYVAGVADGVLVQHTWSRAHGDQSKAAFCVQFENVPEAWIVDAVVQYLRENPDRRRFRASVAVEEVLHRKFPCDSRSQSRSRQ